MKYKKLTELVAKHPTATKIVATGTAVAAEVGRASAAVSGNSTDGMTGAGTMIQTTLATMGTEPFNIIIFTFLGLAALGYVVRTLRGR